MANVLKYGFTPVNGSLARARRYEVASGYNTALYKGDMVSFDTAGTATRTTTSLNCGGVVKEFEYTSGGKRIRDHYLPASTTYSPTARGSVNASYVWVWDQPDQEFWVPTNAAATTANTYASVGALFDIDVATDTGNTTMKRSGMMLDVSTLNTSALHLMLLELKRVPGMDPSTIYLMARVKMAQPQLAAALTGI